MPYNATMITANQQRILDIITATREVHHACTGRFVATQMRLSPQYIAQQCEALRKLGLVEWTRMPGSLRVTSLVAQEPDQSAPPDDQPKADAAPRKVGKVATKRAPRSPAHS